MSKCQCHALHFEDCPNYTRSQNKKERFLIRVGVREWSYGAYKITYDWDEENWKATDVNDKVLAVDKSLNGCTNRLEYLLNEK